MKILAIETSCDDTAVAILEVKDNKFKALSNIVSSQKIHQNYGGVFPMMAKREHQINLVPVLVRALKKSKLLKIKNEKIKNDDAKLKIIEKIMERESQLFKFTKDFLEKYEKPFDYAQGKPAVDLITVTNGPGLEPCLWVGVNFAKALSYFWDIPVIPVNHIEAHILVNFLPKINESLKLKVQSLKLFPAMALVVSGGHTQLILMKKIGDYKIIGETRDDAAGECFDKCAKILGLGYPGGPVISKIASQTIQRPPLDKLPRPMINSKDYDFSFSGLKTAVLYADKKVKNKSEKYIQEMCAEIQQSIIDVLIKKTMKAARDYKVKAIILGGGVSANQELRRQFKEAINSKFGSFLSRGKKLRNVNFLVPQFDHSTDNALMIAVAGYFNRSNRLKPDIKQLNKIVADSNLRID